MKYKNYSTKKEYKDQPEAIAYARNTFDSGMAITELENDYIKFYYYFGEYRKPIQCREIKYLPPLADSADYGKVAFKYNGEYYYLSDFMRV